MLNFWLPVSFYWAVLAVMALEDYERRSVRDLLILGLYGGFLLQFPSQMQLLAGVSVLAVLWLVSLALKKENEIGWADIMASLPIFGYAVGSYPAQWLILGFGVACAHEVCLSVRHRERKTPFITMLFIALALAHLMWFLF